MKTLVASMILASVASTAFAIPPSHPQPILGEAQGAETVRKHVITDRVVSENGFDRTPISEHLAEDGFDFTPLSDQIAEDGFDYTPLSDQVADDGFDRTPLGQLVAEDGSDRTGLGTV